MAAKTDDLPGVEGEGVSRKKIKGLEDAIETWNGIKEKRMALTKKEIEARAVVESLLTKHELKRYQYDDDHEVIVENKLKVHKLSEPDDE
jgi:hypothetical protein